MVSPQKNLSLMAFSGRAWPAAQHFCVIVLCLKRKKNSFFLREFRPISRLRFSLLPSSFLLQTLNPSCVLDQALEDSPVGDQGRVSQCRGAGDLRDSASARRPPRRSRRRGGARARLARRWEGRAQRGPRLPGREVSQWVLAFPVSSPRSPRRPPSVSHVDPPSRPPRGTVPPPRGPLATREAFTPESASRPRTSGSHARGGGNPASVLGKTSAFCLWPSPRPPSAHVLRPHLFPLSSVPWGSSRSPAPPGACSQPHRG